ncbi:PBP1A family penicillin-binding protein [Patescibacteria group bacterium]|nr:MAG: PBP1A family penicillin-binding protein [Patescibacteria group bacterium]
MLNRFKSFVRSNKPNVVQNDWKRWLRILGKVALGCLIAGVLAVLGVFAYFAKDLPSPGKVNQRFVIESTKIFDRTGNHILYEVHGEEKRTIVPFADMAETVRYATIALEDQNFYSHHGVQLTSVIRAALKDVLHQKAAQGGSTITQQFVKNSLLTSERSLVRKIKELILAIEIELKFSKDEILEMYLNEIPYGANSYGVEAGARTFFGKSAKELTLDEAALLAALPQAPSYLSPFGSHTDELKIRQEVALDRMAKAGYITEQQAEEAKQVDVLSKIQPFREKIDAPHFVMYIKEYLESKYGQQAVEQGGLKVYTTLDWDKQQFAEKAVQDQGEKNKKNWNASNAALVSMDPKTGQILAMVGSRDYFDKSIDGQVNVTIRPRQPGSSFKPYVYLTAFQKGYTPETLLYDVETNFSTDSGKDYKPQDYDGKFRGPVKMKEALAQSLNVPAVKTLYLAGVKDSITTAKRMGIVNGLNKPDDYGLSLVLGGGEVQLLDHVNAFGTFATGGIAHKKVAIMKVEDSKGTILEEYVSDAGERVVEEKYIAMVDHILSTNDYRAPVFGANSPLRSDNRPMAAKTGTTNEFRDGWTVGFTPSLVTGVWAGNNNNSAMRVGADGVNVAAPIWRAYMDQALANTAVEHFPKYEEEKDLNKPVLEGKLDIAKDVKVCEIPKEDNEYCLANEYCPEKERDKKDFGNVHTILWFVKKDDPRGEAPEKPESDPQFKNWEKGVKDWYKKEKGKDFVVGAPPEKECKKDDFSKFLPSVSLSVSVADAAAFKISVSAKVNASYGVKSVEIFVNGKKVASTSSTSYTVPEDERSAPISVRVEVEDKNGNKASASGSESF